MSGFFGYWAGQALGGHRAVAAPGVEVAPVIIGEAVPGVTLNASTGSLPGGGGLIGQQWFTMAEDSTLTAISGATAATYAAISGQKGGYIVFGSQFSGGWLYSQPIAVADAFANADDMIAAIAAASSGQVVALRAGTETLGQNEAGAHSLAKSITIMAATLGTYDTDPFGGALGIHPGRFMRLVTIDGFISVPTAMDLKMRGITHALTAWPTAGQTWADIGIGTNAPMIKLNGSATIDAQLCEPVIGYGATSLPFVTTSHNYPETFSPTAYFYQPSTGKISGTQDATYTTAGPAPGWGDTVTAGLYNPFAFGPAWIGTATTWTGASMIARYNYLHDTIMGFTPFLNGGAGTQTVDISHNWVARSYHDFVQCNIRNAAGPIALFRVSCNVIEDPWADARDGMNPHDDMLQIYTSVTPTDGLIRNIEGDRNIIFQKTASGQKHAPQFIYLNTSSDHEVAIKASITAPRIRENIGININKLAFGDIVTGGYVRNNVGYLRDDAHADYNWIAYMSFNRAYFTAAGALLHTGPDEMTYLRGNIYEQLKTVSTRTKVENNSIVGSKGSRSTALATVLATPAASITDANSAFNNSDGLIAGQGSSFANVRDMILAPIDWTGEAVFVGVIDRGDVAISTLTRSYPAHVFGGDKGDVLTVDNVASGLEWRKFSPAYEVAERATVVAGSAETSPAGSAWSSASGTVAVGEYIQFRATSAASTSTPKSLSARIGGTTIPWVVTTATANIFPSANVPGSTRLGRNTFTAIPSGQKFTFLFKGTPTGVSGQQGFIYQLTGGQVNIATNGTSFSVLMRTAGAATILSISVANMFVAGTEVSIALSVDMSAADFSEGVKLFKNGVQVSSFTVATWTPANGNILFAQSQYYGLFGTNNTGAAPGNTYTGKVKVMALSGAYLDLSDPTNDAIAKVAIDHLGPAGEAINAGTAAPIFVVGDGSAMEAGTSNLGGGGAFTKNGSGTFTDDVDQTWPPNLSLYPDAPPATGTVGQPITITFKPAGYAKSGVTLTPGASGVAGSFDSASKALPAGTGGVSFVFTPSATGTLTISLTNNGGYTNPSNFTIAVS